MNVPSRRKDISIKEDLIEEVARIYGYDDIPSTLPVFKDVKSGELTDRQFKTRTVKETLEGAGLTKLLLIHWYQKSCYRFCTTKSSYN